MGWSPGNSDWKQGLARTSKPRRTPQQGRSKATVDAILQAAARVLVAGGYDDLQTNRIAEVAGVGIGSLYEYFPNKDSIIVALTDRFAMSLHRELQRAHSSLEGVALDEALAQLTRAAFSVYKREPKLAAELLGRVPYFETENPLNKIEVPIRVQLAELLGKHVDTINVSSLDAASTMIVRTARRLIDDTFTDTLPHEVFPEHMFDEVEKEIFTMLRNYFIRT